MWDMLMEAKPKSAALHLHGAVSCAGACHRAGLVTFVHRTILLTLQDRGALLYPKCSLPQIKHPLLLQAIPHPVANEAKEHTGQFHHNGLQIVNVPLNGWSL